MTFEYPINSQQKTFYIRTHSRAKRITFRPCNANGFYVTVPPRTSKKTIVSIIEKHHTTLATMKAVKPFLEHTLDMEGLYLYGKRYSLAFTCEEKNPINTDRSIILYVAKVNHEHKIKALKQYFKQQLAHAVKGLHETYRNHPEAPCLDTVTYTYRMMKSRYGSCQAKRQKITLNLELIAYPKDALTYVFVHEMVHLKHPNHSQAFYQELEKFIPDYPQHKERLKSYQKLIYEGRQTVEGS